MKRILIAGLILCVFFSGCSSTPKGINHKLHRILLYNLHFRRPGVLGAQPSANPGDEDYESHPRPNLKLDCVPLKDLYEGIQFKSLRECLSKSLQIQKPALATYQLQREKMPYLELKEDEDLPPSCFKQFLPKIPVPREIFFQSKEEGKLNCYNARMPIVEEELLGIKSFLYKTRVQISLEKESLPKTDQEFVLLLGTWSISPFFEDKEKSILAKVVPTEICRQCMNEKTLFNEQDALPPYWPSD